MLSLRQASRAILVALAVLGVAAGGALAAGGGGEQDAGTGPAFVKLKPFSAPVFRDGRVWGTITLVLNLDVADGVSIAEINHEMPRFQAESLNFMIRYGNSGAGGKALMNLDFLMNEPCLSG